MADGKLGGGLGDISSLVHNQGVSDLSWLAVDEEDYRAAEALPKQNLDIIPELQRALYEGKEGVPTLIPLKPHTIVNRNPVDAPAHIGPLDPTAPVRNRLAQYIMSGVDGKRAKSLLLTEFPENHVNMASDGISSILEDEGLIGNVYVDSGHFDRCATDRKQQEFVKKISNNDTLILAKNACGNCVHARGGRCAAFGNKYLKDSISYNSSLAATHAPRLAAQGRPIDFTGQTSWKKRLQGAYKSSAGSLHSDATGLHTLSSNSDSLLRRVKGSELFSSPNKELSGEYIKFARMMMNGRDVRPQISSTNDSSSKELLDHHGLLGHSWIDMDALGGCREAAKYLEQPVPPEFFLRRSAHCVHCNCESDGCCSQISSVSTIVHSLPKFGKDSMVRSIKRMASRDTITGDQADAAVDRVLSSQSSDWKKLIIQANCSIPEQKKPESATYQGHVYKRSINSRSDAPQLDPVKVRSFISHLMNTGLSGVDLSAKLSSAWAARDLESVKGDVVAALSMDGIQGNLYLDPTVYSDYGKGCESGSSALRQKPATFVLASNKCTGCLLQTSSGWCSKYSRGLLRSIPSDVVASMQRDKKVVTSRKASLPVLNISEKFDLSKPSIDVPERSKISSFGINISEKKID